MHANRFDPGRFCGFINVALNVSLRAMFGMSGWVMMCNAQGNSIGFTAGGSNKTGRQIAWRRTQRDTGIRGCRSIAKPNLKLALARDSFCRRREGLFKKLKGRIFCFGHGRFLAQLWLNAKSEWRNLYHGARLKRAPISQSVLF